MHELNEVPQPRRQIDGMVGEDYKILAVDIRTAMYVDCQCYGITIGRGNYSKGLVIHAKGTAPTVGAEVKRKRIGGNGVALIWADERGKVIGGGFTTAVVPPDWRVPAGLAERAALIEQMSAVIQGKDVTVLGIDTQVAS